MAPFTLTQQGISLKGREMPYINSDGVIKADVILSESQWVTSAVKVLVSVDIQGSRFWVVQDGRIKDNQFASDGSEMRLVKSIKLATSYYPKKWVDGKLSEDELKDGDVLTSDDGRTFFIVRGFHRGEVKLHRLSGGDNIGFDRFSYYQANYGPLKQVSLPTAYSGGRFSEPLQYNERKNY